jgi:hypothetical protein
MIGKTKRAYVSAETDGPLLLCSGLHIQRNGTGKRKNKRRTLAGRAFDANITLHEVEIFLDDAQAETYAATNLGFDPLTCSNSSKILSRSLGPITMPVSRVSTVGFPPRQQGAEKGSDALSEPSWLTR